MTKEERRQYSRDYYRNVIRPFRPKKQKGTYRLNRQAAHLRATKFKGLKIEHIGNMMVIYKLHKTKMTIEKFKDVINAEFSFSRYIFDTYGKKYIYSYDYLQDISHVYLSKELYCKADKHDAEILFEIPQEVIEHLKQPIRQ